MTIIPVVISSIVMTPVMSLIMSLIMTSVITMTVHSSDRTFLMPSSTIHIVFTDRMLFTSTVTPGISHSMFPKLGIRSIPPVVIHHDFIAVV